MAVNGESSGQNINAVISDMKLNLMSLYPNFTVCNEPDYCSGK